MKRKFYTVIFFVISIFVFSANVSGQILDEDFEAVSLGNVSTNTADLPHQIDNLNDPDCNADDGWKIVTGDGSCSCNCSPNCSGRRAVIDYGSSSCSQDATLVSGIFTGAASVNISFDYAYDDDGATDSLVVRLYNETTSSVHSTLLVVDGVDVDDQTYSQTISGLTASSSYSIRFTYTGTYDWGAQVDNILVTSNCSPPVAAYAITPNCGSGQFSISVNVSDLGDGTAVDISDGGATSGLTNVGTGTHILGPYSAGASIVITVDGSNYGGCAAAPSSSLTEDCACNNLPMATTGSSGLDCGTNTYTIEVTVSSFGDGSSSDIKIDGTIVQASATLGQLYSFPGYVTGSHTVTIDAQPYAPFATCETDYSVNLTCNGSDAFDVNAPNILGTCSSGDLSVATLDGPSNFGPYCWNGGVSGMSNNFIRHCSGSFDNETDFVDLWYQVDLPDGTDEMTLSVTGLGANEYVGYILHTGSPGGLGGDSGSNVVTADNDGVCTFYSSTVTSHTITGLVEESTAPIYIRIVAVNPNQSDPCSSIVYPANFQICASAPQPNDVCSNAIDITTNNNGSAFTGNFSLANTEGNDEWDCNGNLLANGDLWFDIDFPNISTGIVPFNVELTIDGPTGASVVAAIYDVTTACGGVSLAERDACEVLTFSSPVTTTFNGLETNDNNQRELQIIPVTPNIGDLTVSAVVTAVNNTCSHFENVLPGFDITSWNTVDFNWATDSGADPVTTGRDLWYQFSPESETDNGILVYSTTIDIQLASLNSGEVITAMLYEGVSPSAGNCNNLASRFISSVDMSANGVAYRLSCMDELHGSVDGGYLIRFVQTAGSTVAAPDILVTPDVNAGPYNNDCENIWDGSGPRNTGTGDAAHGFSAWHILDGEFGTGHFDGATDCGATTSSGVCNGVDYEALDELNDRDVWFTFEVPDNECATTGLTQSTVVESMTFTYGAGNQFRDAILYVYSDCGDANLIDCSGALDGGGTSGAGADWTVSGLTQGQSYLLRVKPYDDGNEYDFSFTVDVNVGNVSPCNNDPTGSGGQGAHNLSVNNCNDYGSLPTWSAKGATETSPVSGAPEKDVWFSFTAPAANGGPYTTTKSWVTVFFESVSAHKTYLEIYNTATSAANGELYSTSGSAGSQSWGIFGNLNPGQQYFLRFYHKESLTTDVQYKINIYDGTGVEPGWECGENSYSNISGCASGCNTLSETWFKIDLPEDTPGNSYWVIEVEGQDQNLDFELRSKYLQGNTSYVACSGTEGASEGGCADFDHPCSSTALEPAVSISSTSSLSGCDGDADPNNDSGMQRVYFNMNGAVAGQKDYYYLRVFETSGTAETVKICNLTFNGPYSTLALAQAAGTPDLNCLLSLPVELTSFDVKKEEVANKLSWTTEAEENTEKFIIERSTDGFATYETLGEVKANGFSSSTSQYSFLDREPAKLSYYRLRIVDFDGYFEFSDIKAIERKVDESFNILSIIPNPTKSYTDVLFSASKEELSTISLVDIFGKIIYQESLFPQVGVNQKQIDLSAYPVGVYFMTIQQGEHVLVKRIVKSN